MSATGSPTKLKSEKAMNPTTSITKMPCRRRRRTKAIKGGCAGTPAVVSINTHAIKIHRIHQREPRIDDSAHRPGYERLWERDQGQLVIGNGHPAGSPLPKSTSVRKWAQSLPPIWNSS